MDYQFFSTNDFILDENFQKWVYAPDEISDTFWNVFLNENPEKNSEIAEARQFLLLFNVRESQVLESKINHLKTRIDYAIDNPDSILRNEAQPLPVKPPVFASQAYWKYGIAAGIVLFLCVYFLFQDRSAPFLDATTQLTTQKGQRSLITLQDGTRVWLNADSQLKYPKNFEGQPQRQVYLQGEAFFDVTENANQPFVVVTSDLEVKVLGTTFNVRSYEKDSHIETTLIQGKVSIESKSEQGHEKITLSPHQTAVFEKTSKKLMLQNQVSTERYTSWREGKLIFEDESLADIVRALERWYNVKIRIENSATVGCRYSAKIDNKTLEEVLELFKAAESIDYEIQGTEVIIKGKLCSE
ncbi:MAG: DUF4974 domain-containing protein [Cyclobacteriaceae bacterium]|nr:DUF4974 domain-containing protein [Cyclobacteriaceae bacterium]